MKAQENPQRIREFDAVILKSLLQDGRRSFVRIAQELGTTKTKIWKHFREMEKRGIITGSTVQKNFAALGFDALATLLISVEGEQLDQVMNYIEKITEVRACRQYNSAYNIRAVTTLKNINDLDRVKEVVRLRIAANGIRTYIWTDVKNIPENMGLAAIRENGETVYKSEFPKMLSDKKNRSNIDELDLRIIDKLASNGRAPFSNIADVLQTSTDTVAKRYRKLLQNHVIKATIQIDPNQIGYRFMMDFNISLKSPIDSKAIEALCKITDVVVITKTSGDYDLQVTAMIRDVDRMFAIQDAIAKLPGLAKIESSVRKIPKYWPTANQYISTF